MTESPNDGGYRQQSERVSTMIDRFVLIAARELLLPFQRESTSPGGADTPDASAEKADSGIMIVVLALVLLAWVLAT
jgi:hypothetical protein